MTYPQSYSFGNDNTWRDAKSKWNNMPIPISCSLYLLQENRYYIDISIWESDDIVFGMFPSYGTFYKRGKFYYLEDISSGAELVLKEVKYSNLLVKKGFCFMKNEYFFKDEYTYDSDENMIDFEEEAVKRQRRELDLLKNKQTDPVPLQLGVYKNGTISLFLELDFHYRILFFSESPLCLLSEGKWEKHGNVLHLYDPSLNYTFLAFVDVKGVKMIRFPNCGYPDWMYDLSIGYPFIMR